MYLHLIREAKSKGKGGRSGCKPFCTADSGLAETLIAMIEGRPVAGFGRPGRVGVPPPAVDGDGTPSLECNGCCE